MRRNAGDYVKSWGAALIRGAASNPEFTVYYSIQLMRLAPLVAPLQVVAACQMYVICAVIKVGQYLHECARCVLIIFNRGIRL